MAKMLFLRLCSVLLLLLSSLFYVGTAITQRSQDGREEWGYVQVRPKAHMFWWLYRSPFRVHDGSNPWPTVLWLQGGPGGSGVGIGNFEEVGPLDTNLRPRNSTWLRKADLLFVDNPVGTGYSYVDLEDMAEFAKSDGAAATDMTALLAEISNDIVGLQNSPLYIIAESYGGKFAVTLALSALRAIQAGKLKLKLGGVALGDSWISPEDYTSSWGPLLKDLSRLGSVGLQKSNSVALKIRQQIEKGEYENATLSWSDLEEVIISSSNGVDFYNFMLDSDMDPLSTTTSAETKGIGGAVKLKRYSRYLNSRRYKPGGGGDLDALMNGPIKKKLKIIPQNVTWGGQSGFVFQFFTGDFMRPRINEVDELLAKGVNVTVYNGQVDLICSTKGTEAWIDKLKWEGLKSFINTERNPLFCGEEKHTKGFTKSYNNLHFYWILGAGHFVPVDQPCVALDMHRYCGKSIPFGSREEAPRNASTLGYFNSAQALADYAAILMHIKKELHANYSPVIVIGGSYGGMLASWFRLKYPHVAPGALASSAPILYFDDITPQTGYYEVATKDFRSVKLAMKLSGDHGLKLKELPLSPMAFPFLTKSSKHAGPLKSSSQLGSYLHSMYLRAAQYNNPLTNPVTQMCGAIDKASSGSGILGKIAAGVFAFEGNLSCYITEPTIIAPETTTESSVG